jgi:hypothetical protein
MNQKGKIAVRHVRLPVYAVNKTHILMSTLNHRQSKEISERKANP